MTHVFRFTSLPEAATYLMHYEYRHHDTILEHWPMLSDTVLQEAAQRTALRMLAKAAGYKLVREGA